MDENTTIENEIVTEVNESDIDREREEWAKETRRQVENARKEALIEARMSDEERIQAEIARRSLALDERERAISRRELTAQGQSLLAERGLPLSLCASLNLNSEADMRLSLDTLEAAFRLAVQEGITQRMSGVTPQTTKHTQSDTDDNYYRTHYSIGG